MSDPRQQLTDLRYGISQVENIGASLVVQNVPEVFPVFQRCITDLRAIEASLAQKLQDQG